MTPVETLFRLTEELAHLLAQENMNRVMKHKHPDNVPMNADLDLAQVAIETRRQEIFQVMLRISSMN